VDLDIAVAMFPDKVDLLKKAVMLADKSSLWDWQNGRPWLGAPQGWTRPCPWSLHVVRRLGLDGAPARPCPPHRVLGDGAVRRPGATGIEGSGIGQDAQARERADRVGHAHRGLEPVQAQQVPLIPHWCYRRKKDGMPYGMVRNLRGPQDTLNKQMSKAIFRMATQADDARDVGGQPVRRRHGRRGTARRAQRTGRHLEFADGALGGNRVKMIDGVPLAEADMRLADYNTQSIRQSSGVGGQQRGLETNVVAAKGILAMQEQGGLLTAEPFDNCRLARQLEGEISLSLIEQYYDQPKTFSVAGEQAASSTTTSTSPTRRRARSTT
jgi:hypothetical protein